MTNPFTGFAFPATGAPSPAGDRTLPARLTDIKNVKDFGATGLGFPHDDWAAIMAAFNQVNGPSTDNRGIVYFPPGTYYVSQPIDFTGVANENVIWRGELGLSTVTGNFADYVFKRTADFSILYVFDKLHIVNTNATGGGIRAGGGDNIAIRDCTITANLGLNNYNADTKTYFGTLECSIESCTFSPGSNPTNSIAIMAISDGPILNCRIVGFNNGIVIAGGEGCQNILGCYFEQCGTAIGLGIGPDGTTLDTSLSPVIAGCWFKNNSIAINLAHSAGLATIIGCRIDGTNGQAPGGLNPQYGILNGSNGSGSQADNGLFAGISVTGQYDGAGIFFPGNSQLQTSKVDGVQSVQWDITPGSLSDGSQFDACNVASVITVAQLPGALEGDCYNVTDGTNSLAWGAPVTNTGTHTTHYKVRYNGSNFTVVGQ